MTESKAALLLFPNLLGDSRYHQPWLPGSVDKAVTTIDGLIAESDSAARRFLSRFETKMAVNKIPVALLNEHTPISDMDFLLEPIRKGERWGLISDAGLPCIADPGYQLVRRAQLLGLTIQAFVGPSSLTMALMLSGLPGQHFSFHGYLEKDPKKRIQQIIQLERASKQTGYTQIFIEAPYRNQHLIEALVHYSLDNSTTLCVAWDLTLPTQGVLTQKIENWKKSPLPNLEKKNAVFLFTADLKE